MKKSQSVKLVEFVLAQDTPNPDLLEKVTVNVEHVVSLRQLGNTDTCEVELVSHQTFRVMGTYEETVTKLWG